MFYTYRAQFLEANLTFHTVSVPKFIQVGYAHFLGLVFGFIFVARPWFEMHS